MNEFRLWLVSVLMDWMVTIAPKNNEGLVVLIHLHRLGTDMLKGTTIEEMGWTRKRGK